MLMLVPQMAQPTIGDSDYTAVTNRTLTFVGLAGETQNFTVTPTADTTIETDETVLLSQSNLVPNRVSMGDIIISNGAIVTINNDDAAAVTISDAGGFEDDGPITLTATLDNAVAGGFTVDVSTADGTASTGDGDYTAFASTLNFAGTMGETQTFTVTPTADSKLESDETLTVSQSSLAGTVLPVNITDGATIIINNDDAAAVTIDDVSGNEDDGSITVTATLDNAVSGGFTVDINTADGTATTADSDYTAFSGETLNFAGWAGETQMFTFILTVDTKVEANETLIVSQSNLTGTALPVDITDGGIVTINNDDSAAVTIADVAANEDDGAITVTVTLDVEVDGGFTVDVSTADGTATTADSDYTSITSQTLNFAGNAGESRTFDVTPMTDTKVEADESILVSQSGVVAGTVSGDTIDITDAATVTINNDDSATVTIADTDGLEDGGAITVMATLDVAVDGGFDVDVSTADGTAMIGDSDYTAVSGQTLTFVGSAGETQNFTVTPTADTTIEPDETVLVGQSRLAPNVVAGGDIDISDGATVTITNDDTDLAISKVDSADPINSGNTLTYTITVNNLGPATATNVVVSETLPAEVTLVSTNGCAEDPAGVPLCSLGDIASGASAQYTVSVTVDPGTMGTITNTASVTSDNGDPVLDNNLTTEDTEVFSDADLSITKTDNVDPGIAGEQVTYTVTVNNAGPGVAENVVATDTLPAGVTLVSTSGCNEDPSALPTCSLGNIDAGASAMYTITVALDSDLMAGSMITNMASVTSDTNDPDTLNNMTTEDTMIGRESDLSIMKSDSDDPVVAGTQLTYTIDYANAGPSDAANVTITDTLPTGTTYASDTGGCVEAPAGTLICNVGTVANGEMGQFTITVDVASSVADGANLSNMASIASDSEDLVTNNSSATEPTGVIREIDLEHTATESTEPVVAGSGPGNLIHTITLTNNGPSDASNIDLIGDVFAPPGVVVDSIDTVAGSDSTLNVGDAQEGSSIGGYALNVSTLAAGASFVLEITMTVGPSAPVGTDNIDTVASVDGVNETDTNPGNDDITIQTSIERQIDLVVTKTDNPDPVVAGFELGGLEYVVTVTNNGPSDGDAVVINDPTAQWPVGVVLESHLASAGAYDGTDWTVDLPAGETETLTMTVTVGPDTVPGVDVISNTAAVTGSGGDEMIIEPTADDTATTLTTVDPTTASWTVSKDFLDDSGSSVTATLTCDSGEVTGPEQVSEGGDVTLTVERFLMGPFGTTDCEVTESKLPAEYFQVSASEDCEVDGIVHEDEFDCDFVNAPIRATFEVTKNFTDDNPADVRVVIECNTGLPLMQEGMVSEFGNPFDKLIFIVQDYEVGTLNCDIFEEPIPAGYDQTYNATADPIDTLPGPVNSDDDGCHYEDVSTGTYGCEIVNRLLPVDVTVNKEWFDDKPEFQNPEWVDITFTCNAPILDVCDGGIEGCSIEGFGNTTTEYIDPDNPGEFRVIPHWDGSTVCSATEESQPGVIQDQDDCAAIPLAPGQGGSCTLTNTRFYEGIPTLSQYGLMLLSLLMLGMGAFAFRRFI